MHSPKTLPDHVCFHLLVRCHHCQNSCVCKLAVYSAFCVLDVFMFLLLSLDNYLTFAFGSVDQILLLNFDIDIFFRDILDSFKSSEIGYKWFVVRLIVSKSFFFSQVGLIIDFDMVFVKAIIIIILQVSFR